MIIWARQGFFDSTPLLADRAALRARVEEDGYLFLRGVLPAAPILRLRRVCLEEGRKAGLIGGDSSSDEATAVPGVGALKPDNPSWGALQARIKSHPEYLAVRDDPLLLRTLELLLGVRPIPNSNDVIRVQPPGPGAFPHQDVSYAASPEKDIWTVWLPLGDVSIEQGPIAIWPGSHRPGVLPPSTSSGALAPGTDDPRLLQLLESPEVTWAAQGLSPGDLVLFTRHTVHGALTNQSEQVRLSLDARYERPALAAATLPRQG